MGLPTYGQYTPTQKHAPSMNLHGILANLLCFLSTDTQMIFASIEYIMSEKLSRSITRDIP